MKKLAINFALFFAVISIIQAQTGKISGVVKDKSSGEALPGVNVIIEGTSMGASTDVDGFYVILNVPVGRHEIRFTYVGYSERRVSDVIVNIDNTSTLNAELVEEVNVGDVVTVVAQRELIRRSETNSRQIKNSEEIKNMPITSVQGIVALTSGVVRRGSENNVNVRGGRLEDTAIMIDGVNTNSSSDGLSRSRLNKNAIEEVTVQSGGFGAEFGGVMSGLIQTTTKTGSSKYNVVLEAVGDGIGSNRGDTFLGTNTNGYRNLNLSIGGPILPGTNNHFFFLSADMLWENDDRPSWGTRPINQSGTSNANEGTGYTNKSSENEALNLVFNYKANLGTNINLRLGGTLDNIVNTPYLHDRSYFGEKTGHAEKYETQNITSNLTFTHTIDKNTYYSVRFGQNLFKRVQADNKYFDDLIKYGDVELNRFKGDPLDIEEARKYGEIDEYGIVPDESGEVADFVEEYHDDYRLRRIRPVNQVFNRYRKRFEKSWDASIDLFKKINKHQIKIGGGFRSHELRKWTVAPAGLNEDGEIASTRSNYRGNVFSEYYGYNLYGNWVDDGNYINGEKFDTPGLSGADAPRKPSSLWFYASDEWVQDDFILTLSLRVDHFNPNWINFINPLDPVSGGSDDKQFDLGDTKESETFTEIQPRVGFAFPVDENTKFSANIGRLVQMPLFNRMYTSMYEFWNDLGSQGSEIVNPNLKPEENTSYEISVAHQISKDIALNVRTYYRTIKNLVQYQRINSTNTELSHYFSWTNVDWSDSKGLELSIETRRINNLRLFANYTYASAVGSGSTASSNRRSSRDTSQEFVKYATDLEHDVPHQLNINMDYRLFEGEGPIIAGVNLFQNMGFNLIYNVQSGRPYTKRDVLNSFKELQIRFAPIGSSVNGDRGPSQSSFDLRVDKTFPLQFGATKVNLNLYVDVENLFNQENILDVQRGTGSVNEDGYLATSDAQVDVETDNEYKRDAYRYLLNDPSNWGAPRIMRIGLRFEF